MEAFRYRPTTRPLCRCRSVIRHRHRWSIACVPGLVRVGRTGPPLRPSLVVVLDLKAGGSSFSYLFVPESQAAVRAGLGPTSFGLSHAYGGYQGAVLSSQYFGLGVFAVVVAGLLIWRHDRRLWLFGGLSLVSLALSFGAPPKSSLHPWQVLAKLPEFDNIVPSRFVLITYLSVAVMLGLIVGHTYQSVRQRRDRSLGEGQPDRRWSRLPRWSGAAAGVIVAGIAIVPPAAYLGQNIPISTEPLVVPTWFATVAPHLRGQQVLFVFQVEPALMWQAVDQMHFSIAEGGGPQATFAQEPKEIPGIDVIGKRTVCLWHCSSDRPERRLGVPTRLR